MVKNKKNCGSNNPGPLDSNCLLTQQVRLDLQRSSQLIIYVSIYTYISTIQFTNTRTRGVKPGSSAFVRSHPPILLQHVLSLLLFFNSFVFYAYFSLSQSQLVGKSSKNVRNLYFICISNLLWGLSILVLMSFWFSGLVGSEFHLIGQCGLVQLLTKQRTI